MPVKSTRTPGKMKITSENTGKERVEQRKTQDEETKLKYEEQNQFLKEPKCLSFVKVNQSFKNTYIRNTYWLKIQLFHFSHTG